MTHPWMFIAGCAIVGWIVPEFLRFAPRAIVPIGLNMLGALAGGLIAAAFV